ncbi:3-deoxy-manno-octulosonate-8-phosphatase KdsC [Alteromonas sp. S015]|uniref:3-deoxy-manno-octulosonate-8-phosphatase KdsC n=1 Tax=Alteromonas sp. S015 TaxID=3117401 RepID=UPI002FE3DE79
MATTLYTDLDGALFKKLAHIKLLVCDVDGVFSDGRIYLGNEGEELKAFHTRDGYGVKALVSNGVNVAVITGRRSAIVENRMKALNVAHIIQGEENKAGALSELMKSLELNTDEVAAVGDDMPDTGMFNHVAVKIAVADAHPYVAKNANWITSLPGGFGAVREISDTILQAKGVSNEIFGASV